MAESFPDATALPAHPAFPDPLISQSGAPVKTKEQWEKERAPELRELFQHYEYGYLPPAPASVTSVTRREDKEALGGKATLREVTLSFGMPDVEIHLLLVTPNHRSAPAPVFLGLNFNGNHALLADPLIAAPNPATYPEKGGPEPHRAKDVDVWNIEQSIDRGYAVASFFSGDVVPDQPAPALARLKRFRSAEQSAAPNADDCATLAAWAWGIMRAVDYLIGDSEIDGKRIAVVGHSRNGKAAMLAGAMDERIAMVLPLQAGCGGTAPCRVAPEIGLQPDGHAIAETIKRINTSFPYWFCAVFKEFSDVPDRLPFDQHELIALCAPRPVMVCAATEDLWANPAGQLHMVTLADPVYRLVSGEGWEGVETPVVGDIPKSRLAYFIRAGKHSMAKVDWEAFLAFADRWLK